MPKNADPTAAEIAVAAGWFVTGALWFVQALVPWTRHGSLSHSSALDASSLVRSGDVGSLAPAFAGWLLLVLPVLGLLLCGSAFSRRRSTEVFRWATAVVAVGVTAALVGYLTDFELGDLGTGALLALIGCATFAITAAGNLRSTSS